MNQKIKDYLTKYNQENNWPTDENSLIDTLTEAPVIYKEETGKSRWWNNYFRVTEINGLLIGYGWAETFRDESPDDCGWEFNTDTIVEVEQIEITTTVYVPKIHKNVSI